MFLENKIKLATHEWRAVYSCAECDQKWLVDLSDKLQETYAIRGDNTADVESRTGSLIKELIIKRRGGLEETKCIWRNCPNKNVKGLVMCVDHLYESGHRG